MTIQQDHILTRGINLRGGFGEGWIGMKNGGRGKKSQEEKRGEGERRIEGWDELIVIPNW